MDFREFPKLARWSRDVVVTEKLDGDNASIHIRPASWLSEPEGVPFEFGYDTQIEVAGQCAYVRAGSRTRWLRLDDDNKGFANWVHQHAHELGMLGGGHHFGEWWGKGIGRGYAQAEKHFSLFNTARWSDPATRPDCCDVVPVLYQGPNTPGLAERMIDVLVLSGSAAAPGWFDPEGIVLWHTAAQVGFKKTVKKDESPKSLA